MIIIIVNWLFFAIDLFRLSINFDIKVKIYIFAYSSYLLNYIKTQRYYKIRFDQFANSSNNDTLFWERILAIQRAQSEVHVYWIYQVLMGPRLSWTRSRSRNPTFPPSGVFHSSFARAWPEINQFIHRINLALRLFTPRRYSEDVSMPRIFQKSFASVIGGDCARTSIRFFQSREVHRRRASP